MTDNNESVRGRAVAWCELTPSGKIAFFDGKPMVMVGPVGNEHHTTPLVLQSDLAAAIARVEADEDCWREGWAFAYSGSRLYGDDGELQDNSAQPFIDWRRDSAQEIRAKIQERGNRAIAAQQTEA